MILSVVLAAFITLIFIVLGLAKIIALPRMREMAAHAGFSTSAYRRIGMLEVAGAAGVAIGPAAPLLGGLAAAGLLLLLAGALATHVRNGERPNALAPAGACAVLVAAYLGALFLAPR